MRYQNPRVQRECSTRVCRSPCCLLAPDGFAMLPSSQVRDERTGPQRHARQRHQGAPETTHDVRSARGWRKASSGSVPSPSYRIAHSRVPQQSGLSITGHSAAIIHVFMACIRCTVSRETFTKSRPSPLVTKLACSHRPCTRYDRWALFVVAAPRLCLNFGSSDEIRHPCLGCSSSNPFA